MPAEGKGKRESTEFGDRTVTVSTGPLDPKDDPNQHPLLANVPTQGGCKFLDPCQLKKTLGRGGMGAVYLGWHPRLNVFRAIKVLNAELAADADYLERFEREARTAARIEHENLVRVFDVRECRNVHYIIMEYVEGENLDILVQREGPFPIDEALAIIRECARGLAAIHLHESPIAHRDIKPANIMRSRDGVIKITDLGLAKELSEESQTLASVVAGTPNYMPREQWQGLGRVGPPGDVFALGATLYYLLAGEHAFYSAHPDTLVRQQDVRRKIVEGELPDFQARIPGLFPELKELLIRCLNRDPDARFAHGGALLTEGIEPVIAAAEALAAAPPPVRKPRSRLQGALAAVGVILLALTAWWITQHAGSPGTPIEEPPGTRERQESQENPAPPSVDSTPPPVVDATPPTIEMTPIPDQALLPGPLQITGTVDDEHPPCSVTVNGIPAERTGDTGWRVQLAVPEGDSTLSITAEDSLGNRTGTIEKSLSVPRVPGCAFVGSGQGGLREYVHGGTGIRFVRLPGGSFPMGSPEAEPGRQEDEGPVRTVTVGPFLIAKHEVSQAEWKQVMGVDRLVERQELQLEGMLRDELPMLGVTWTQCREFCARASAGGGADLELPTEAQWEYACRAGTQDPFAGADPPTAAIWFQQERPQESGKLAPNAFGLHDMLGNVYEWCLDDYDEAFYRTAQDRGQNSDPLCSTGGTKKVARGGCYLSKAEDSRAAIRGGLEAEGTYPIVGFRPVLNLR